MNKKCKFTALSLGMLTLATVGLSSCGNKNEENVVIPEINAKYVYDGTHIYTATDTNNDLVKNGKTDYTIVIPEDYSASLRIARTEFIDLFKEATGLRNKLRERPSGHDSLIEGKNSLCTRS